MPVQSRPDDDYRWPGQILDVLNEFTRVGLTDGLSIVKRAGGYWWCCYFGSSHWVLDKCVRPGSLNDPITAVQDLHLDQWVEEGRRAYEALQMHFRESHGNCPDFAGRRET